MEIKIIFIVIAVLIWIVKQITSFNKKTSYKGTDTEYEEEAVGNKTFEEILKQFAVENRAFADDKYKKVKETVVTREDVIESSAFSKYQGTAPKKLDVDMSVKEVRRRNEHYRIKKKKKNKYLKMLKDSDSVKKAFVGSLVFERKKY